jgi:uncharacterized protein involved in exopolysaccharide biosynthesis
LNVSPEDTFFFNHSFTFGFKPIDRSSFELSYGEKSKRHYYNALVNIGFAKFYIAKKDSTASIPNEEIRIEVRPTHLVAAELSEKLKVEAVNTKSNVIRIALRDPVQKKAIDVLNSLIKQYREDAIEDKNQISINTSDFINERIKFITAELSDVEGKAESYKTRSNLVDIPSETEIYLNSESELEKEIVQTNIQLQISKYVFNYLSTYLFNRISFY